ncbi:MAG: hypothetical protein IPO87_00625 [Flavobacteriales bacterium]|nr:hypothetical protein [Flavobacteriales bacterium]
MLRIPYCFRTSCIVLLGASPIMLHGQSAPVLLDGLFDDWTPALTTFVDNNSPTSGVDLVSMQVTNDDQYLFIKLVLGSETDLLDNLTPQTLRLYIDGDNNATTGFSAQTGYGAELQIKFDTRTITEYFGTSSTVSWSTLDLVPLPTVTSDSFEIAIARNALPDGVHPLFASNTIKLLFIETDGGDAMPNSGTTFSYTFNETPVAPLVPINVQREQPSHVRISSWNVLADGITDPALEANYQRILTALAPDILGLSECVSSTASEIKTRLDDWLPIGGSGWQVVKDDYDMVIASRWPILQTWPALSRQFPALIDLPGTYSTDLLFTAAHLNCCTADATRQNQADAYVQFVQDARTPGGVITVPEGTPMVYSGDLNLVGYAQQLKTLLTGDIQNNATYGPDGPMDWDGSPNTDVVCAHTDARMAYTWRSNTSAYPSGRLDLFLYTDAVADLAKSFALRTEIMPANTLQALGLQLNDANSASDHFPITVDLVIPLASVLLQARAVLEGPYVTASNLMHDSLRVQAYIPLSEPYTALGFAQIGGGGETILPGVLNISGANAIVDWVFVELRDAIDPAVIRATRCVLLQRDGDIVDLDGMSSVGFAIAPGNYRVGVRHRSHLGVLSAAAFGFSNTPVLVDLASATTATFGTAARKDLVSAQAMWAGDVVRDGSLRYTGLNNDRDPILARIGGSVATNVAQGYLLEDINLDGRVKYTGSGNDRDVILVNIGGTVATNTRAEQLP